MNIKYNQPLSIMSSGLERVLEHLVSYYPQSNENVECMSCGGCHLSSECRIPIEIIEQRRQAIERLERRRREISEMFRTPEYLEFKRQRELYRQPEITISTIEDCVCQIRTNTIQLHKKIKITTNMNCGICFDEKLNEELCEYGCSHNYCKSCTLLYLKHCIDNNKTAMCPSCRIQITSIHK